MRTRLEEACKTTDGGFPPSRDKIESSTKIPYHTRDVQNRVGSVIVCGRLPGSGFTREVKSRSKRVGSPACIAARRATSTSTAPLSEYEEMTSRAWMSSIVHADSPEDIFKTSSDVRDLIRPYICRQGRDRTPHEARLPNATRVSNRITDRALMEVKVSKFLSNTGTNLSQPSKKVSNHALASRSGTSPAVTTSTLDRSRKVKLETPAGPATSESVEFVDCVVASGVGGPRL